MATLNNSDDVPDRKAVSSLPIPPVSCRMDGEGFG